MTVNRSTAAGLLRAGGAVDLRVTGISLGHRTLAEADHWIHNLDPAPAMACTHLVATPYPHVAITVTGPVTVTTAAGLREAATEAAASPTGRAAIFPGSHRLIGVLTVADVVALSGIDRVDILGGETADPDTDLDTRDFVRPRWQAGQLVLVATPAAGGRLVPFESPTPTPCCAGH